MVKYKMVFLLVAVACAGFTGNGGGEVYPFPKLHFFPAMPKPVYPITKEGADLGRHLFYDPILSGDSTMSCASCHKQAAAFSDAPSTFSAGRNGAMQRRNTLPLFNLAWHTSFFWDGRAGSIEAQVLHPVRDVQEMNLSWASAVKRVQRSRFYRSKFNAAFGAVAIDSNLIANAIGQFERTILSYRSKYDRALIGKYTLTKDEADGFVLVNDMTMGDCLHCHTTDSDPLGSTFAFSNNGIDSIKDALQYKDKGRGGHTGNVLDNGKFKIPSLRNLAFTAPYMHDGRFRTLEAVIDFYSDGVNTAANIDTKMEFAHHGGAHLTKSEKQKIIAFLLTMTDSALVSDPAFSNPFLRKKNGK